MRRRLPYWLQESVAMAGQAPGLSHTQLRVHRGLKGIKLGPANRGRRLPRHEREEIERRLRSEGRL